jgi:hypothetical protein
MSCVTASSALHTLLSSPPVGRPLSDSSSDLFSPLTSHLPLITSRPILSHPNTLSGADVVTQVATKRINWSSYHIDSKKDNIGAPLILILFLLLLLVLHLSSSHTQITDCAIQHLIANLEQLKISNSLTASDPILLPTSPLLILPLSLSPPSFNFFLPSLPPSFLSPLSSLPSSLLLSPLRSLCECGVH